MLFVPAESPTTPVESEAIVTRWTPVPDTPLPADTAFPAICVRFVSSSCLTTCVAGQAAAARTMATTSALRWDLVSITSTTYCVSSVVLADPVADTQMQSMIPVYPKGTSNVPPPSTLYENDVDDAVAPNFAYRIDVLSL